MDDTSLLDELLSLERRGWGALCDGTGAGFYGSLMTDGGVMVLAHGVAMDRDAVVGSLADAPSWRRYEISDERLVSLGPDAAAMDSTSCQTLARRTNGHPLVRDGMLEASKQFRRDNGHMRLPALRTAPQRHVAEQAVSDTRHDETVNAA